MEHTPTLEEVLNQLRKDYDNLHRLKEEWKEACYKAREKAEHLRQENKTLIQRIKELEKIINQKP